MQGGQCALNGLPGGAGLHYTLHEPQQVKTCKKLCREGSMEQQPTEGPDMLWLNPWRCQRHSFPPPHHMVRTHLRGNRSGTICYVVLSCMALFEGNPKVPPPHHMVHVAVM